MTFHVPGVFAFLLELLDVLEFVDSSSASEDSADKLDSLEGESSLSLSTVLVLHFLRDKALHAFAPLKCPFSHI